MLHFFASSEVLYLVGLSLGAVYYQTDYFNEEKNGNELCFTISYHKFIIPMIIVM